MLKVFLTGPHAARTPLSYPALWPLFKEQITRVDHPAQADLYVFAHVLDIQDAPFALIDDWRARARPLVLLSEEPFWDTIWGKRPRDPLIYVDTAWGALPVHQLNHCTSDIFGRGPIPYYLLTNHRFANAYRHRFARNAARSRADWQQDLAARPVDVSFLFERRAARHHWVEWPEADLTGLCSWRTDLAEACTQGIVERLGRSWQGGPSRFELTTDWHVDKLVRLDGRARCMGAIENTHHPDYMTEKFFDALACGSMPAYWASPGHRVHDLGLPDAAWVNLWGLTPEAAAARISDTAVDPAALLQAQQMLARHFADPGHWQCARQRLARSVLDALDRMATAGS
ncbi:MAG: glycosyltransferase family 10 [Pseudomonadota bacterium]